MATKYGGYMGKVLDVNLTTRKVGEYPWTDEDRELYLGGKIMAAKILYDNIDISVEPFSEENLLVFTTGPITGSGAPSSCRFNVSTRSPLTGFITSSNCGGSFAFHIKKAGYDGVVVRGKADKPVWLEITDEKVEFHDAAHLWGKTTGETQALLGKSGGKVVIGPAGENLVRYAGIFSQERAAGRGGTGAVMGYKNLKAIVASGKQSVNVKDREGLKEHNKKWVKLIQAHPLTGHLLPEMGTANLLRPMQERNMLATRNFGRGQYKDYEQISGEYLRDHYLVKNTGCLTCPIQCARVVEVNGKQVKGPELETLGLLGANLENNSLERILEWNYLLDELGMDTMSAAGTIAFAMEAQEKGLWDSGLEFGQVDNLSSVFEDIAYRRGIGDLLAEGSKRLAEKFGGKEFAINVKGMELAAYEPRGAVGQGLGYAVANRGGCHLNSGYLVLMEGLGVAMDPYTIKAKPALTIMVQNLMEGVSAGGNCLFTVYNLFPGAILNASGTTVSKMTNKVLKRSGAMVNFFNHHARSMAAMQLPLLPHTRALSMVTGRNITMGGLIEIGERGYNLERLINVKLGLTEADDSLPARLTDECQIPGDNRTRVPLIPLKREYYRNRGWNENGAPADRTLKRLRLPQ